MAIVKTHMGKTVDMTALITQNGHVRAAGNTNLNARGDLLGADGKVIKTKEQMVVEYHEKNPKSIKRPIPLNATVAQMFSPTTELNKKEDVKSDKESLTKFDLGDSIDDEIQPKKNKNR